MQQQPNNPPPGAPVDDGKTVAILAYCTLIGFIIAIVMHGNSKTKLGAYHLRQALGLLILGIGMAIVGGILAFILFWIMPFLASLIWLVVWGGMLFLLIMGLVNAANAQEKPVPIVGKTIEKILGSAFN